MIIISRNIFNNFKFDWRTYICQKINNSFYKIPILLYSEFRNQQKINKQTINILYCQLKFTSY